MIKYLILLLLISSTVSAQLPAEEAILAAKYAMATNSEVYTSPDSSVTWIFEVKHLHGRRFRFKAEAIIARGGYMLADYQPSNPIGLITQPSFKFRQFDNLTIDEGDLKERARSSTWHKCTKYHKCETDNALRIYKGVTYSKKFSIKKKTDPNKRYFEGYVVYRMYSAVSTGDVQTHSFRMRF